MSRLLPADRSSIWNPKVEAAVLEARGMTSELPEALDSLQAGRAAWEQLGRPLDAARCGLLLGERLRGSDPALRSIDAKPA